MEIMVVLRALLYRMRQGGSWRTLNIFGNWRTIYGHWRRWVEMGIWEQILKGVSSKAKGTLRSIDSTSCKVHKHGHGGPIHVHNQDIGRSRGGPNTKIHALVDSKRRIVDLFLSPGNLA
jgi:transposase